MKDIWGNLIVPFIAGMMITFALIMIGMGFYKLEEQPPATVVIKTYKPPVTKASEERQWMLEMDALIRQYRRDYYGAETTAYNVSRCGACH